MIVVCKKRSDVVTKAILISVYAARVAAKSQTGEMVFTLIRNEDKSQGAETPVRSLI